MRGIENHHCHGAHFAVFVPGLRALQICRSAQATPVDHSYCPLYDQVRIHLLLLDFSARVTHLHALKAVLDRI